MEKIKGFKQSEIEELAKSAELARNGNGRLQDVFDDFAKKHGRAKGSVRNFYYEFMRMCDESPSLSQKYFSERPAVNRARAFSVDEEKQLLEKISDGKKQNKSVRRTIIEMAGGDEKLMLRYQNKYRNLIKAERVKPEKPRASLKELKDSINELVARIAADVRAENDRLRLEIARLERENAALRLISGAEFKN